MLSMDLESILIVDELLTILKRAVLDDLLSGID